MVSSIHQESYHPGTQPNSEPENQCLVDYIQTEKPHFILSLHSWNPLLNTNGDCKRLLPSFHLARVTSSPMTSATPRQDPWEHFAEQNATFLLSLTEVERHLNAAEILRVHVPAVLEGLKVYESH